MTLGWILTVVGCLDLAGAIHDAPNSPWIAELMVGLGMLTIGGFRVFGRRFV